MKRLSLLLISIALLFGMAQCKKKVEPIAGETVHITLDVDGGGKYEVYPSTGAVVYTAGDVIYVGNGGKYVGSLTYVNGAFSGTLTGVVTTDYLHFYFVSGLTPSTTPSAGSTASFTVNISDQSSALPVLSYGKSNIMYTSGTTAYSSILENKCGLVKFVLSTATNSAVTVGGLYNVATVNFGTPGITPTGATGTITLKSENTTEKWAILLPQVSPSATVSIDGYSCTATVPTITNNMYEADGVSITNTPTITVTTTVVSGIGRTTAFSGGEVTSVGAITTRGICWGTSVNPTIESNIGIYADDGETGNFSVTISGLTKNTTYHVRAYATGAIGTVYGADLSFTTTNNPNGTIGDLFTVDASGTQIFFGSGNVEHVNDTYKFASTQWTDHSSNINFNVYYFDKSQANSAVTELNAANYQGTNSWRLLTPNEWLYVFNGRITVDGTAGKDHNWKWITITDVTQAANSNNSMTGALLFPDGYGDVSEVLSTQTYETIAQYEAQGCVFLPAAGARQKNYSRIDYCGSTGYYWSSDFSTYVMMFSSGSANNGNYNFGLGGGGFTLRLVLNVN